MSRIFELWIANYPRDASPHGSLCANYYFMGQYEKALAECEQSLRLDPDDAANYENLVTTYFDLNRLPEAKAALDQAQSHGLDSGALRWCTSDLPAAEVRGLATAAGGTALHWRGGEAGHRFHPLAPTLLAIHRRLKARFDPHRIFNPGRLIADL